MEKNKSQKILIIIIIILVVGLIGFLVYDHFTLTKDCKEVQECPKEKECSCNNEVSTTNSFEIYRDNIVKQIKDGDLPVYKTELLTYYDEHYRVILNNKMELSFVKDPGYGDGKDVNIVLKKNVIDFGVANSGSSGIYDVYIVNYDGTVEKFSTFNYFQYKKIELQKFKKCSNIISVNQGSYDNIGLSNEAFFIDVNGKICENEYSNGFD